MGAGGAILHTADGGVTWLPQVSPTANTLTDVRFTDALHGWASTDAQPMLVTQDGGVTWATADSGVAAGLAGLWFTDAARGWAVGMGGAIMSFAPPAG